MVFILKNKQELIVQLIHSELNLFSIFADQDECKTGTPCATKANTRCINTVGSYICVSTGAVQNAGKACYAVIL